jgi:hypothetical protein
LTEVFYYLRDGVVYIAKQKYGIFPLLKNSCPTAQGTTLSIGIPEMKVFLDSEYYT